MEMSLALLVVLFAGTLVYGISQYFFKKERLPNVEFLRISDKPGGKAGDSDDVQAFLDDSLGAIMKGYYHYSKQGKHFLLRTPRQVYFIAAPQFLEEIRKLPDSQLSQPAAAIIIFQIRHNFHKAIEGDSYHFNVVRGKMRQALTFHLPALIEESGHAFDMEVGNNAGWRELKVWTLVCKIVTRITNRMLVGEPLCRNEEYLQFSNDIAPAVFDTALKIRNYPEFVKTIMMYFMTERKRQQAVANKYLLPLIRQRLALMITPDGQDKVDRPNDTIQWLLDMTPPEKRDPEILMHRLVHINVNAIHAPAYTITECVFDLCRHTEIHEELREEIAEVMGPQRGHSAGWSKDNLDRLLKLDSFIRESSRQTPMSAVKMERYAVRDTTLSDGTFIPKGTSIGVIAHGRHMDNDIIPNAKTWDPFRYARLREGHNPADIENTFAEASPENMLFGMGRHACPGRHFASVLCKIFLVCTLVRYDVKFIEGLALPQGHWTQKFRHPDVEATIAWKPRSAEKRFAGIFH